MVSSFLYHMFTGIQRVIDQLRQLGVKYHFAAAKRLLASRKREAMINHLLAAGALSERLGRPEMMTSAARMLMRLGIFERAWQLNCASCEIYPRESLARVGWRRSLGSHNLNLAAWRSHRQEYTVLSLHCSRGRPRAAVHCVSRAENGADPPSYV